MTPFEEWARALPPVGAVVGLDPGTKTIGVAVSDVMRSVASPLAVVARRKFTQDAAAIDAAVADRQVVGVVVRLPLNMDDSEGPRVQSARAFARNLARRGGPPVTMWDERLSTVAAERALLENDLSRAKRAGRIDAVAAGYILQGALDRLANLARG